MKFYSRTAADQCAQDLLELKDSLDYLKEGCTPSTCVSKFLDNVSDPDYSEDSRALARSGAKLDKRVRLIRRVQSKLN